jgi:hypothetical protein
MLTVRAMRRLNKWFKKVGLTLEEHEGQAFFCILKANDNADADILGYKLSELQMFRWIYKYYQLDLRKVGELHNEEMDKIVGEFNRRKD